jgi:hypothetical protein
MDDNKYGLIKKATIEKSDIINCIKHIITTENTYSNICTISKKQEYITLWGHSLI